MGKRILNSSFYLLLLLIGCAIPDIDNSPSGRQEMTVTGTDSIFIGLTLTNEMLKRDYILREQSRDLLVFEKHIGEGKVTTAYATHQDWRPCSRVTYRLLEQGETVRVVADLKIVRNPDTHSESESNAAQQADFSSVQNVLRQTKQRAENREK